MDSFLATNSLVEELVEDQGKVVCIRAGNETFYADSVILAEGDNNLQTRQAGLQSSYVAADHILTGVKEDIRFDRKQLEDRVQLNGLRGMSNEVVGNETNGVEGGGRDCEIEEYTALSTVGGTE